MINNITVKVRCFSHVKQAIGQQELTISLPTGSKGTDLEKHVKALAQGRLDDISFRLAINKKYSRNDMELNDGDEVALIPPVQGG